MEEIETAMMLSAQLKNQCKDPTHHSVVSSCKSHLSMADTVKKFTKKPVCCTCLSSMLSNTADLTSLDVTTGVLTDAIADSVPRTLGFSRSDTASRALEKDTTYSQSKSQTEHTILPSSPNILSKIDDSITNKGEFVVKKLSAIRDTISELNMVASNHALETEAKDEAKTEVIQITITDQSGKQPTEGSLAAPITRGNDRALSASERTDNQLTLSPKETTTGNQHQSSLISTFSETEPATHNRTAVPESEPSLPTDPLPLLQPDTPTITVTNPSRSTSSKRQQPTSSAKTTTADDTLESSQEESTTKQQATASNKVPTSDNMSSFNDDTHTQSELRRLANDTTVLSTLTENTEPNHVTGGSSTEDTNNAQQNINDKVKSTEV